MRRLSSLLTTVAIAASALSLAVPAASAAPGTLTKKTATVVAPSSVPNAQILKMARLTKSNSFLAIGYDKVATGSHLFVWKVKEDLTVDATFAPVDLGASLAMPSAANSVCVANSNGSCWNFNGFSVNEAQDRYYFDFTRYLNNSGNTSSVNIDTIVVGKISTGEVVAKVADFIDLTGNFNAADWSAYGASRLTTGICTSTWGATFQSVPLAESMISGYSLTPRPDGSLVVNFSCNYNNINGSNSSTNVKEFKNYGIMGLKVSGATLISDTSWGTSGVLKTFDDTTKCGSNFPLSLPDASITSNSEKKVFLVVQMTAGVRSTTSPYGGVQPASFNGCGFSMPNGNNDTTKIYALEADGSISATNTVVLPAMTYINRWVIDPKGNWNTVLTTGVGQSAVVKLLRLNTKGEFDTTNGTDGMKTMTNVPTSITVNGTSVSVRYTIAGLATTANGYYFTGFTSTATGGSCNGQSYNNKIFPYYLSPDTGLLTTYGTSGLGEGLSLDLIRATNCSTNPTVSYINSKGQHSYIAQVTAIGSQAAGFVGATWDPADGVTGGGDGSGAVAAAGRVDAKVYSTKLPTVSQADSALKVLTAAQAKDLDIRTTTPKICVALTTSVLLVNPGRCVVQIIDEDTKKVLRSMTTTVKDAEVDAGTTLTTDEPIMFKQASTTLSKAAKAQVAELAAAAKSASRVVIIGHSAALGEVSAYSYAISRDRALAVKAALVKAGVKATIEVVALSYNQPETTKKTEAAQAKNRRAEVFIFP